MILAVLVMGSGFEKLKKVESDFGACLAARLMEKLQTAFELRKAGLESNTPS